VLLLAEVHPEVVQERLGYATISITVDTYSHVIPTLQRAAADLFAWGCTDHESERRVSAEYQGA
jgi:hypothetical protein